LDGEGGVDISVKKKSVHLLAASANISKKTSGNIYEVKCDALRLWKNQERHNKLRAWKGISEVTLY
jgi:hypothetical protein